MTKRLPASAPATLSPLLALATTLLLVVVPSVYVANDLGGGHPQQWDAYYTLMRSLNLLETGDWLSLHDNFAPDFNKPPLQYMLTAMLLGAGLDRELALRVWPFIFTIGSALLTGALAGLMAPGRWWVIPSSVALLVSSREFWAYSRFGLLESGQNFFLLLTFCGVLLAERNPRWWIATGVAVGLGFLQKSPVAPIALAFWLWMQNRLDPDGSFAWARLKQNEGFRAGCWTALVLCALWPGIQIMRHGGEFLMEYVVVEWLVRFFPTGRIDTGFQKSPFQWLGWLAREAPQIWCLALALLPAILRLPRFRGDFKLRGLAWLIVLCALMLTLARGKMYSRYILVLLPFLAITTSIALAELLPRRWMAPLLCVALLASNLPSLAGVRDYTRRRDMSEQIEVGRRFRERLGEGENAVFVQPRSLAYFPSPAFVYYAALDRPTLIIRTDRLDRFEGLAAKRELEPPYLGLSHSDHLPALRSGLGAIEEVEEVGNYMIWRLPRLPGP